MRDPEQKPGLQSVYEGREARKRGRYSRLDVNILIYVVCALLAVGGIYRYFWSRKLEGSRQELLRKVHAAKATVGAEWTPMRDALEAMVKRAAVPETDNTDQILPEAKTWEFRSKPGLYLRIRLQQAQSDTELRNAVLWSVRDAFPGCFLKTTNVELAQGVPDAGVFPEQPWNLKQAYQATRILSPEWEQSIRDAEDDLRIRIFDEQYQNAQKHDIPLVIDILKKAEFLLILLDEDVDEARSLTDGGPMTVTALEQVKHPVRIAIFDVKSKKLMIRLRREVESGLQLVRGATSSPEIQAAMQRQANNCALALEVSRTLKAQ
jgi:hypothetical protein